MRVVVYIAFLTLFFLGCKASKKLTKTETVTVTKTVKVIERDTVITTKPDSTYYKAFVKCVNNKPILMPAKHPKDKEKKALKRPRVVLRDRVLTVNCEVEAQKLFLKWKEKYTIENKQTKIVEPVKVPRSLTWWQILWMTLGKFFVGFIVLFFIYLAIRVL